MNWQSELEQTSGTIQMWTPIQQQSFMKWLKYGPIGKQRRFIIFHLNPLKSNLQRLYRQEAYEKSGPYDGYDIAVLRLAIPLEFSDKVLPICTSDHSDGITGSNNNNPLVLTGFGRSSYDYQPVLQVSTNLRLLSASECKDELDKIER